MAKTVKLVLEMISNKSISGIDVKYSIIEIMRTNISKEEKDVILNTLIEERFSLYQSWYFEIVDWKV